jgi:hypothetical protein
VGRGAHLRGDEWGSVLRTSGRCYVTSPRAQMLTGVVAPDDGAGNAGSAQWVRASGNDTRRAWISVASRSAGSPQEGATPREARGRLRRRGWQAPRSAACAGARPASRPVRRRGATTTNSTGPV